MHFFGTIGVIFFLLGFFSFGLIVAMIIQIFQNFFVSMIDKQILEMEEYSAKILDRLYESK